MPVRIYDLAKKLGMESKAVLAKAKELGITTAKVPSSSLDKITAEFLEEQLAPAKPVEAPKAPEPVVEQKIQVIHEAPPPPVAPEPVAPPPAPITEPVVEAPPAPISIAPAVTAPAPAPVVEPKHEVKPVEVLAHVVAEPAKPAAPPAPVEPPKPVAPPPPPAPPAGPKLGDKVGFIQLPQRPGARTQDRGQDRGPQRGGQQQQPPQQGGRQDAGYRGDIRSVRGGTSAPSSPSFPGQKIQAKPGGPAPKAGPSVPANAPLITFKPPIIVRDLAERVNRKPFQIIADLMEAGIFANVNQSIDEAVAQKVCAKYGFRFEVEKRERGGGIVHAPIKKVEIDIEDKPEQMKPRAPVVTIMGHVDHGKTSLLDVIRKSDVVAGEAGGITQHIGAYTISFPHPERKNELQQITFLDTPGHAAFSAMRARGANVTDIVVLVVAANDGVMPQTLEALAHAQAAKVPILVAVNKMDHPNANALKVRQQLQDKGLVPDEWGGDTIFVDVSALTKQGVDKLLEMILLQADLLELKANPDRLARGNVIESGLEPGGPTATVLVRKGTLHVGDVVISGKFWGKVRALINEEGKRQKEAGPSVAVKVLGLNGVPEAGVEFSVLEDEKAAREMGENRAEAARLLSNQERTAVTLENIFETLDSASAKSLKVIVKADTQGSVEAIVEALKKIEATEVGLEIIHSAVGTITESDVLLASASHGIILGFHTRIDVGVADLAKREGVQIKLYSIIYELIDEVKSAMAGLLEPVIKETVIGSAEVRKVFALSKGGNIAGCMVASGRIVKGKARVMRRKNLVYEGIIQALRRFQDEVNEVRAGMECGIRIDGFGDYQPGDLIESYTIEKVAPKV
ncbi:MAG: translation initiation factor IF-2 [Limisphaerales bacterium]